MDWKTRSATRTEQAVIGGIRANGIVLMHDIHASTAAAAPGILRGLQAQGVTIVTLSELSLNSGGYQAGRTYCSGVAHRADQTGCSY